MKQVLLRELLHADDPDSALVERIHRFIRAFGAAAHIGPEHNR